MNEGIRFNQDKLQKYIDKIDHLDCKCGFCGNNEFSLDGNFIFHLQKTNPGERVLSGGVPFIMIICNTCGNTHLINAFNQDLLLLPDDSKKEAR